WSVEPYYVYWRVSASPVSDETATFTVNGITAREQLGAFEPLNTTREFGIKLGFHVGYPADVTSPAPQAEASTSASAGSSSSRIDGSAGRMPCRSPYMPETLSVTASI